MTTHARKTHFVKRLVYNRGFTPHAGISALPGVLSRGRGRPLPRLPCNGQQPAADPPAARHPKRRPRHRREPDDGDQPTPADRRHDEGRIHAHPVDHEDRRREIVRAAIEVVKKHGYQGLTLRSLAAQMGGSSTLVTHYFRSRRNLSTRSPMSFSSGRISWPPSTSPRHTPRAPAGGAVIHVAARRGPPRAGAEPASISSRRERPGPIPSASSTSGARSCGTY